MKFFRSPKKSPKTVGGSGRVFRRLSMVDGGIARKLRFTPNMSETEILDYLKEAKDNPQMNVSFDEIYFTNDLLASMVEAFGNLSGRYNSHWDRLNLEFCRGPVDMVATTALFMNCVRHLFIASDEENAEELVVRVSAALRVNISLKSLWLLLPLTLEATTALGNALGVNDAVEKLHLSGCKWEMGAAVGAQFASSRDNDSDSGSEDAEDYDDDDTFRDASQFMDSDDEDEELLNNIFQDPKLADRALQLPRALASGLRQNSSLRTIDLSACGLPDEALGIVIQSLAGHPTLENLDVSKNRAGIETVKALAEVVAHAESNLTRLDLREQRKLPTRKAKRFFWRTGRRKPANGDREADDDDEFGANSQGLDLMPLSQALYNNEVLQVLLLSHNQLSDDQVAELVRNLQGNDTMQELDLQYNSITTRGLKDIAKGLSELPALTILLLGGNNFGKEGDKILAQLEDDDDSVCTILDPGLRGKEEEDNETFHSAKSSKTKASKSPAGKPKKLGLMDGLTGIAEK